MQDDAWMCGCSYQTLRGIDDYLPLSGHLSLFERRNAIEKKKLNSETAGRTLNKFHYGANNNQDQELSCFSLTNYADPKWNKRPLNSIIKLKRDRTSKEYCQITHIQRWFLSLYNMVQIIHIKIHSLTHLILQTDYPKYCRNGSSMLRTPLHRTMNLVRKVFYSHCM